jgi:hypothetical protein
MAQVASDGPGKLRDGFNMIARDLDRAFALAFLSPNEHVLLQYVREGSWVMPLLGRQKGDPLPDPVPFRVNISALADEKCLDRTRLSKAMSSLLESRILVRVDARSVLINKDYTSWIFPGTGDASDEPRFKEQQLANIRDSRTLRPKLRRCVVGATLIRGESATHEPGLNGASVAKAPQACGESATVCVAKAPRAHRKERAYGGEEREFESSERDHAHEDLDSLSEEDRGHVERACEYAERAFPLMGFGRRIRDEPAATPGMQASWWLPALVRLHARPRGSWRWDYLNGIVRGFLRSGGPSTEDFADAEAAFRPPAACPSANGEAPAKVPTPEELEAADRAFAERCKARLARERKGGGR